MAEILISETPIWGIKLQRRGDVLTISPASKCPPELKALLREHKLEILSLLEAADEGLSPDQRPWLAVARQVLAGEFEGADGSTREAILIGLRSIPHPVCEAAVERLGVQVRD